ncbi:hypothetical protein [Kribbella lupini]|uniref:Pyrroloquinoline-quinone binding quinoprotein n=1 Tax=Kribbella lupini TaxID=291602 RepID=A0ABN2BKP0_9ACTN
MLRQVFAATAAVTLLAGCSGGDDKSNDSPKDGAVQTSSTPTPPAPTAYDPPKAFQAVAASALPEEKGRSSFKPQVAMAGTTAVANSLSGAVGQSVTGEKPWQTLSTETTDDSVVTNDATQPAVVQLDGKSAVAVVYYQRIKGGGTAKPSVQALFRWLDPADGKPISEAMVDVTPLLGDNEVNSGLPGGFTDLAVDASTGQVAVGVAPTSLIGAKSGVITVIADPGTKKGVAVPFMKPAGLGKGVLVGAQGKENTRRTLAFVDAATGKVTKSGLLPGLEGLEPTGALGSKYAYLYGQKYTEGIGSYGTGDYVGNLYAVDPATGQVVQTKTAVKKTRYLFGYTCHADAQKTVVCSTDPGATEDEIVGFDDTTGKKLWGYTATSPGRVVPTVSAVFHGMVYATVQQKPVLVNALTGQDVPVPTPTATPTGTPGASTTPTDGSMPTDDITPGDTSTPSDSSSPSGTPGVGPVPTTPDFEPLSPVGVSEYGGAYLREADVSEDDVVGSLQILKAIG